MKNDKIRPGKKNLTSTEKKLQNVRTCLYVLILAAITKIAMMDFYEFSLRPWINMAGIFLIVLLVLAIEKGLRRKVQEEKEKGEQICE